MAHQVLFVDDDTPTRYIYREILSRLGLEVTDASDGLLAIEQLSRSTPSVVILDLLLPRKSGIEVLEFIYSCPRLAKTRVIIFSAQDSSMVRNLRDGDIFLQKPLRPQYVRDAVMRMVSSAVVVS